VDCYGLTTLQDAHMHRHTDTRTHAHIYRHTYGCIHTYIHKYKTWTNTQEIDARLHERGNRHRLSTYTRTDARARTHTHTQRERERRGLNLDRFIPTVELM